MHTPPLQKPRPLVPPPDEIMTPGRRSKRNSVANAVTVTGVTEALLVGEWGKCFLIHAKLPNIVVSTIFSQYLVKAPTSVLISGGNNTHFKQKL